MRRSKGGILSGKLGPAGLVLVVGVEKFWPPEEGRGVPQSAENSLSFSFLACRTD